MSIDFNTAPEQRAFDLIPADTICAVKMTIRPGGHGEDKMLKRSRDGGCEMLDCEFSVIDGQYAGRKFWESLILNGTTSGHAKAADISAAGCGPSWNWRAVSSGKTRAKRPARRASSRSATSRA